MVARAVVTTSATAQGLQIRLLGELEVVVDGRRLPLPPSKKTRALLGYLVLSDRPHRRERLCDLLWDVADDRRAALRWSLSKLRELLDTPGCRRLHADRERVSVDLAQAQVDVLELKALLGAAPEQVPTPALETARALFRGDLLEGLNFPDFHEFYAWCVAERQLWRERQRAVLAILLARADGDPGEALPLARELVQLDPLDEGARVRLHELLHTSGKLREAQAQSVANRRPLAEISAPEPQAPSLRQPLYPQHPPLVGRRAELSRIQAFLGAGGARALRLVLIRGEAGVGKSRLLRELTREDALSKARVVTANVPEVRTGWPYAPWLQVFGALAAQNADAGTAGALDPLLSPAGLLHEAEGGRERLFRAAAAWIERSVPATGRLLIALEDVHWLDDASAELLHFIARTLPMARVGILMTARAGELQDQPQVARVFRTLRREDWLEEVELTALTREKTLELVAELPDPQRRESVYLQSAGNPLFALELAREIQRGGEALPTSISRLVRDRLDALTPESADVLRWAAVLGSHFDAELLAELVSQPAELLVELLEQLERRAFLRLGAASASAPSACAFSHDIVRRSIYDQLSEPRRRLMHARVARLLEARPRESMAPAATLAHHAALGGDRALATRACVSAGQRSLSLFASSDAALLARRGLAYAEDLPDPERTCLSLELLHIRVLAGRPDTTEEISSQLIALTARALDLGVIMHARLGFYLRSLLMYEEGRHSDARHFSREAERISRLGTTRERVAGLVDAARCLACLERDLPEAEAFLFEAEALAQAEGIEPIALPLTRGMLATYRGEIERAASDLDRARELAQRAADRFEEFWALEYRADLELVRRDYARALSFGEELAQLGERLREGSEAPYARALLALLRCACDPEQARAQLEEALHAQSITDDKRRRALLLVRVGQLEQAQGSWKRCHALASEALALAESMERPSDAVLALALLVDAEREGASATLPERAATLRERLLHPLSAEARAAAQAALARAEPAQPRSRKGIRDGARDRRTNLR
jgi:DNA-binding SARP family transcriptional activator/tetratricopeptide (TPR) repeat protein